MKIRNFPSEAQIVADRVSAGLAKDRNAPSPTWGTPELPVTSRTDPK